MVIPLNLTAFFTRQLLALKPILMPAVAGHHEKFDNGPISRLNGDYFVTTEFEVSRTVREQADVFTPLTLQLLLEFSIKSNTTQNCYC